jgi:hypothetical protein
MNNTGGPAFPVSALVYNERELDPTTIIHDGMTMRDYFAAQSLKGLISATSKMTFANGQYIVDVMDETHMTKIAYSHADAMLKAREQ